MKMELPANLSLGVSLFKTDVEHHRSLIFPANRLTKKSDVISYSKRKVVIMNTGADNHMQIGELAKKAKVSQRTIHYYEELGLLSPAERKGVGYRYYDNTALKRLNKIAALKNVGLNLEEIASVLDLYFEDATGLKGKEKVLGILHDHLKKADRQISDLQGFMEETKAQIKRLEGLAERARNGETWD